MPKRSSPKCLLATSLANDGVHFLEWVAYHRAIGISDIAVFSSRVEDGGDLLAERLAQRKLLRHERRAVPLGAAGIQRQTSLIAKAANADWHMALAPNAFLNVRAGDGTLADLLSAGVHARRLCIGSRIFACFDPATSSRELAIQTCTTAEVAAKESARTRQVRWDIVPTRRPADDDGITQVDAGVAQVNHYLARGMDAFVASRSDPRRDNDADIHAIEDWSDWSCQLVSETSITRHVGATERELERLLEDPVTRHLHEGTIAWHRARIATVSDRPPFRRLREALTAKDQPPPPETVELLVRSPKRHLNRLRLLRSLPRGGRVAEIGVWKGGFSSAILSVAKPRELVLIDPWESLSTQDPSLWTHPRHGDHAFMAAMGNAVARRFADRNDVVIKRGFSADVLAAEEDGSFDWVYIDGCHRYDIVRQDLELSFAKVRPGGKIVGDDYSWTHEGRCEVRDAVRDCLAARGIATEPEILGQQFILKVPE